MTVVWKGYRFWCYMGIIRFFTGVLFPCLLLIWTAIAACSALAGPAGYRTMADLAHQIREGEAALHALELDHAKLEKHADRLGSGSLDPDLLDERIRGVLLYSKPGDVIISRKELYRLFGMEADG